MEEAADKAQYTGFEDLKKPQLAQISDNKIKFGFESKQWILQFQTTTILRQANKHYLLTFLSQLLPIFYKDIISQVQNLRSNNSKQALTLLTEIFTYQDLNKVNQTIIRPLVNVLFSKSVSEKGFLKSQALKAINNIPKIQNPHVTVELMNLTKSNNANISELAIKTLKEMYERNQSTQVSDKFLKDLSYNINGKRSVVQKQAKQILVGLKKRVGQEKLQALIDNSSQLDPEETNTLKRQLKKTQTVASKGGNFKQFMKLKKNQMTSSI